MDLSKLTPEQRAIIEKLQALPDNATEDDFRKSFPDIQLGQQAAAPATPSDTEVVSELFKAKSQDLSPNPITRENMTVEQERQSDKTLLQRAGDMAWAGAEFVGLDDPLKLVSTVARGELDRKAGMLALRTAGKVAGKVFPAVGVPLQVASFLAGSGVTNAIIEPVINGAEDLLKDMFYEDGAEYREPTTFGQRVAGGAVEGFINQRANVLLGDLAVKLAPLKSKVVDGLSDLLGVGTKPVGKVLEPALRAVGNKMDDVASVSRARWIANNEARAFQVPKVVTEAADRFAVGGGEGAVKVTRGLLEESINGISQDPMNPLANSSILSTRKKVFHRFEKRIREVDAWARGVLSFADDKLAEAGREGFRMTNSLRNRIVTELDNILPVKSSLAGDRAVAVEVMTDFFREMGSEPRNFSQWKDVLSKWNSKHSFKAAAGDKTTDAIIRNSLGKTIGRVAHDHLGDAMGAITKDPHIAQCLKQGFKLESDYINAKDFLFDTVQGQKALGMVNSTFRAGAGGVLAYFTALNMGATPQMAGAMATGASLATSPVGSAALGMVSNHAGRAVRTAAGELLEGMPRSIEGIMNSGGRLVDLLAKAKAQTVARAMADNAQFELAQEAWAESGGMTPPPQMPESMQMLSRFDPVANAYAESVAMYQEGNISTEDFENVTLALMKSEPQLSDFLFGSSPIAGVRTYFNGKILDPAEREKYGRSLRQAPVGPIQKGYARSALNDGGGVHLIDDKPIVGSPPPKTSQKPTTMVDVASRIESGKPIGKVKITDLAKHRRGYTDEGTSKPSVRSPLLRSAQ